MNKTLILLAFIIANNVYSQTPIDSTKTMNQENSSQKILSGLNDKTLTIGAYGELTYNQPESKNGEFSCVTDFYRFMSWSSSR